MNKVQKILKAGHSGVAKNSPAILSGVAVTGVITTAILASTASLKAYEILKEEEEKLNRATTNTERQIETVKLLWPVYVPPVAVGLATIICIVSAHKVHARRAAAIAGAYAITETAFRDYQNEVVELLGQKKERTIQDGVIEKKLNKTPIPNNGSQILITNGDTLCFDALSGRYFRADIEKLRQSINEANNSLYRDDSLSLNELYYFMGLPGIELGSSIGWSIDDAPIEANYSSHLLDGDKPCLAINFTVSPLFAG